MSLISDRNQWEKEAQTEVLPDTVHCRKENISGVDCVWVSEDSITATKLIVYLHGGGLVAGSAVTHQGFAARIVQSCKCNVLLVNYRLLPENDYPAPLMDVLAVYKTLVTNHGYSPDNLILGGDSSGGGLALAALTCLRDSNTEMPVKAFMLSGAFDMTLSSESQLSNESTDLHLSKRALKQWQAEYLNYDLKSPLLSPLYADLSGLPPILLIAGSDEPWVSDSVNVAGKVKESGGTVQLKIWNGMGHVFPMDAKLIESSEALQVIADFTR